MLMVVVMHTLVAFVLRTKVVPSSLLLSILQLILIT